MKDYEDFPPIKYFLRVLKNSPKSALLYVQIWKKSKKKDTIVVKKKDVRKDYLLAPALFRNLLLPLTLLNLINYTEDEVEYIIDLSGMPE